MTFQRQHLQWVGIAVLALAVILTVLPVESATILGSHGSCGPAILVFNSNDAEARSLCDGAAISRLVVAAIVGLIGAGLTIAGLTGRPQAGRAQFGPGVIPAGTADYAHYVWSMLSSGQQLPPGTYVLRQPVQIRQQQQQR